MAELWTSRRLITNPMMRNEALALLKEYVKGDNMLTPCLADLAVKAMQRISGDWGL